ncbi:hypothetical protein HMPREF0476_1885 [Kingella kingae ATCC 23330]|uniref:Uncharacterized protein n=1 Tax=Kingella kingae ATCC 23330 TaxID=887327 RepID=F5S9K2_KINKI|nr:hypothetical protein HMPREF0476_1885 [Kingella kingae ATCC 23330]
MKIDYFFVDLNFYPQNQSHKSAGCLASFTKAACIIQKSVIICAYSIEI